MYLLRLLFGRNAAAAQESQKPTGAAELNDKDIEAKLTAIEHRLAHLERAVGDVRGLVGPFGVPFPDGSMLVQTLHGIKYFIDPTDDIMAPQLVVYRQWEADLTQFMLASVGPDTVFMDVGANFGYFTCLTAARIGSAGKGSVVAVEPNPKMLALLRRNVSINWSMAPVEVHACAVADRDGYLEFNVPDGRAANAGLVGRAQTVQQGDHRIIVPTKTLAGIAGQRRIDLMKIDVEGFEALVLGQLGPVLEHSPHLAVIMEWSLAQMNAAGFSADDLIALLDRFGLEAHRVPAQRDVPAEVLRSLRLPTDALRQLLYDNLMLVRRT
jgi:FkbM family methyltransferase